MAAKYDLKEVHRLVKEFLEGDPEKVFLSLPRASTQYVIRVYKVTPQEAEQLILDGLLLLDKEDFCRTIWHTEWQVPMDEYGLEGYRDNNWYIKFFIADEGDDRFLSEVSFHPVEKELHLSDGRTLKVTYEPEDG